MTGMLDPKTANFLIWWPTWRIGDIVYFQNQILFMNLIRAGFNDNALENYIPKRMTMTDKGEKISEWSVSVKDIRVPELGAE